MGKVEDREWKVENGGKLRVGGDQSRYGAPPFDFGALREDLRYAPTSSNQ